MPLEYLAVRCFSPSCGMFQVIQKKKTNKWQCKVCQENQSLRKVYGQSYRAKDLRELVQKYNMDSQSAKDKTPPPSPPNKRKLEDQYSIDDEQEGSETALQGSKWASYLDEIKPPEEDANDDAESESRFTTLTSDYQPLGKKRRIQADADHKGDEHARSDRGYVRSRGRGQMRGGTYRSRGNGDRATGSDKPAPTNRGSNWSYRPTVTSKGFSRSPVETETATTGKASPVRSSTFYSAETQMRGKTRATSAQQDEQLDAESDVFEKFSTSSHPSKITSPTSASTERRFASSSLRGNLTTTASSSHSHESPSSPISAAVPALTRSLTASSTSMSNSQSAPSSRPPTVLVSTPKSLQARQPASKGVNGLSNRAPAPSSRWAAYLGEAATGNEDKEDEQDEEEEDQHSLLAFGSLGGRRPVVPTPQFITTAADDEVVEEERE